MSCSSDDQSDKECPLCMEQLEIDDWNFYPCKCEYQICRFCWHRLRTDENGLCPACRQPYPEEPLNFKPLSTADMAKMKSEKKMKQQAEKQRISESRKHLASYRVLQKNLVYVVGLSARVADPEMLKKPEYFGKYGKITKVAVGTTTSGVVGSASHTAYVTYLRVEEALRAIQGVQNALVDGRVVKASLGTTKYCSSFLRSQSCYKPECMYLHDMADADISFTKEDMHAGKHAEYEKRLMDTLLKTAAPPPIAQSIVPPQPLISSTLSNTLAAAAAAAKKKTELNGNVKDPKSVEEERREREKEEERKMEEEFPPVSASVPLNVPVPVPPTPSSPVPSTVPSTSKLNGKKKSEDKSNILAKPATVKKEKKEKAVIPSSPATRIPRDIMTLPRELSASPPDDWTSRDDGPSCSPPPGLPAPPHLVAANSSTTMTPPSESSISPPRGDAPCASTVSTPQWQTLLGLAPRPVSPPCNGFFSDDDLGFDPFHESSRELAALVEEERKAVPPPPPSYFAPPPALPPPPHLQHLQHHQQHQLHHQHNGGFSSFNSFGMDSMGSGHFSSMGGLSSLYSGGLNGLDSSPLDAFSFSTNGLGGGSSFPSLSSHSVSSRFPIDMTSQSLSSRPSYDPSSSFSSSSLFPPPPPPGLGVPHGLTAPPPPGLGPPRPMMASAAPGMAPPSGVPQGLAALAALRNAPPSTCSTSSSTRAPLMSKAEWQEGFKSLLPNINVRFSAELERELR